MSITIPTSLPTSSNQDITSGSSAKNECRDVVKSSSSNPTSSISSNPNFFTRLPPDIIKYIFSFDHSIPLPLCNNALHTTFVHLLQNLALQLPRIEAKEVKVPYAQPRQDINTAVLAQLKTMRTLFTRYELEAETGVANPDTFPLSLNPHLPLYLLTAYAAQWKKLVSMSETRQKEYSIHRLNNAELCLWPNILNLKLRENEVKFSELSNVTEQHNQIEAAWETAKPSLIRSLFRDNIDRLHDPRTNHYLPKSEASKILSKFLQKPEAVKHLLPKDLEYALLHILTNELTFDMKRQYNSGNHLDNWDFNEPMNSLFAYFIKANVGLDSFKVHLQRILRKKALEFQQQEFTKSDYDKLVVHMEPYDVSIARKISAFSNYLSAFKKTISTHLRGFVFPVEFTNWTADSKQWQSPQGEKCIVQ